MNKSKLIFFILILFVLIVPIKGVGQSNTTDDSSFIDSLTQIIQNKNSHDTVVVNSLLLEVNYYYLIKPDTAVVLCKRAMSISEKINYINGRSSSYGWLGYLLESVGDIEQSLEYSYKSLKLYEENGQKREEAYSLNNIGFIHYNQGELDKALVFFNQSLKVKEEIGDRAGVAMSFNNLASVYGDQGSLDTELEYLEKSLDIYLELNDQQGQALSYNNIASVYNKKGIQDKALEYHKKSLQLREETGDKQGIVISYHNIGRIHYETGDIKLALSYAEKAMTIAKEIGFPSEIKDVAILLSNIYETQGNGMEALQMHKLYISMRDSINNDSNQQFISEQQVKYQYEKKKAIDEIHNDKLLAIKHEEKERQKVISISIGIGLLLVLLFLLFVFSRLKATRKQKQIIELQKEDVEMAHTKLAQKSKEVMDSIIYAKRIQSAILPPLNFVKENLKDSFIIYKPKDIVAGDFYWLETVSSDVANKNIVLFAAADCTGHGVPGAMVSVVCNGALNRSVREYGLSEPGLILDKTREIVIQEFQKSEEEVKDGMDIALCSLETTSSGAHILRYAGAHNPLWIMRNGEIIETRADKQPIGKFDHKSEYTTHTFELIKGDIIYLFSDGFVDQFGGKDGKKYKAKSFRSLLTRVQNESMEQQKTLIEEEFESWKGELEQLDDVCIIGVRV